jgi:hypothetical protein
MPAARFPRWRILLLLDLKMPSNLREVSVLFLRITSAFDGDFDANQCDLSEGHIPNTELITPRHGFALVWSGFRTRSLGRGGSLGAAAALARWLVVFFPATMFAVC